jgi:hypothetical protein
LLRAEVLLQQKREAERVETIRRAVELFPVAVFTSAVMDESLPGLQLALANVLKRQGNVDEALRVYTELIDTVDKSDAQLPTPFRILNQMARERAVSFRASTLRGDKYAPALGSYTCKLRPWQINLEADLALTCDCMVDVWPTGTVCCS